VGVTLASRTERRGAAADDGASDDGSTALAPFTGPSIDAEDVLPVVVVALPHSQLVLDLRPERA
jgi:hypothetical protein